MTFEYTFFKGKYLETLLLFYAGLLGLIVGSFLNVVIYRVPLMLQENGSNVNLFRPGSHCTSCKHPVKYYDNIPLLSFFLLKGKCRSCKHPISWQYPFVEIVTCCFSLITAWHFGLTFACAAALIFTWSLLALAFIDKKTFFLPDDITLPLLWLGIIFNYFSTFCPLEDSVIGAVCGYLSFWLINKIFYFISKKEGMGYGDFKLFAALGAWLGWQALPLIILIASFTGSLVGFYMLSQKRATRHSPIPFGPFLAFAGWISLLWHDKVMGFYKEIFLL